MCRAELPLRRPDRVRHGLAGSRARRDTLDEADAGAAPGRSGIRLDLQGSGAASVETGLPVLDRLLERLAHYARWDLALEVEPGTGEAEVAEAGAALGKALAGRLRAGRAYGFASMTSAEAPASVVPGASGGPLAVSNGDLTEARIGGVGTGVARRLLERSAGGAG